MKVLIACKNSSLDLTPAIPYKPVFPIAYHIQGVRKLRRLILMTVLQERSI